MFNEHILSTLIVVPALAALLVAYLPDKPKLLWRAGLAASAVQLVFAVSLAMNYRADVDALQFTERFAWIPQWGAEIALAVDGFGMMLILLTAIMMPIVLVASEHGITHGIRGYIALFFLLEAGIVGSVTALDLLLFYVFWEIMLIPMFLIIGMWGGQNRIYASVKFILYTMVGSLLMLVAIVWLYFKHGATTFNVLSLYATQLTPYEQFWLFLAFALAFAIKVPLFPFHTWLPDAHTEAPTGGSVILAAVLLKLGGFGFLRFAMPLFPVGAMTFAPLLMLLATIGIVYGALVSRMQPDMKRLVAFSSVSHLGFAVLGLASGTAAGIQGAIFVMLSHGLTTGALFLLVGILYDQRHTRLIEDYGGLMAIVPTYSWTLRFVALASAGLPGLSGFVGEFLVLVGASQSERWGRPLVVVAATGMVFSAVYMLWMFQRVMMGPVRHPENRKLHDMTPAQIAMLAPLVAMTVWLGVYPNVVLSRTEPLVQRIVKALHAGGGFTLEAKNAEQQTIFRTGGGVGR